MSVTSSRYAPAEKMTLRRFVRVTYDNFRQLIQTIATPPVLPMPVLTTPPSPTDDELSNQAEPGHEAEPGNGVVPEPLAAPDAELVAESDGPATLIAGENSQGENSQGENRQGENRQGQNPVTLPPAGEGETEPGEADSPNAVDSPNGTDTPAVSAGQWPLLAGGQALTLAGALESLLFVTDDPAEPARLARVLGVEPGVIEAALQELDAEYRQQGRGLRLQVRAGRYQIVTAPEAANLIEAYLNLDTSTKLSAPALETLAVIAYRQPVTRAQIEAVRGVDCSGVLRSLLQRGLIEEVGRVDAPGRPVLYGITDLFMHHFGLTALHELPPLESAELERIDEALSLDPVSLDTGSGDGVNAPAGSAPDTETGPA